MMTRRLSIFKHIGILYDVGMLAGLVAMVLTALGWVAKPQLVQGVAFMALMIACGTTARLHATPRIIGK